MNRILRAACSVVLPLAALALIVAPLPAAAQKAPGETPQSKKDERKAPGAGPGAKSPQDKAGSDPAKSAAAKPLTERRPDSPEQRAKLLDDLYAHLAAAPDERAATEYAQAIMRLWAHSGSDTVDLLVQRGLKLASDKNYDVAQKVLDAAVELAPDYAEAWNARGQVFYLQNDYERALGDLRRTLALDPNHFKALEGVGSILREVGQKKGAFKAFEKLIQVHPFYHGAQQVYDDLKREVDGQGI